MSRQHKFGMDWCRVPTIYVVLLVIITCQMVLCQEEIKSNATAPNDENLSSSIEEKVLGPLRIWHIVFIVCFVLLIAMVAVFCCVEIRVPRSRQEIEENYKKRLLNQKYVRMLEKAPGDLMRAEFPKSDVAVISSKKMDNSKRKQQPQQASGTKGWQNVSRSAMTNSKTSLGQDDEVKSTGKALAMFGAKNVNGGPQPLAINPKDILAIMAQQRKTKASD